MGTPVQSFCKQKLGTLTMHCKNSHAGVSYTSWEGLHVGKTYTGVCVCVTDQLPWVQVGWKKTAHRWVADQLPWVPRLGRACWKRTAHRRVHTQMGG